MKQEKRKQKGRKRKQFFFFTKRFLCSRPRQPCEWSKKMGSKAMKRWQGTGKEWGMYVMQTSDEHENWKTSREEFNGKKVWEWENFPIKLFTSSSLHFRLCGARSGKMKERNLIFDSTFRPLLCARDMSSSWSLNIQGVVQNITSKCPESTKTRLKSKKIVVDHPLIHWSIQDFHHMMWSFVCAYYMSRNFKI